MTNVDEQVRSRVVEFVSELTTLIRQAAIEAVRAELGGEHAATPGLASTPSRAAPTAKASPASKATASMKPTAGAPAKRGPGRPAAEARRPGQKRDPGDLTKLVELLFGYIKANPGQRMEQIIPALGIARKDLALPIRKLIHANRITSKGEKRGTVYSPKG
jgi:hypothetical protein